MSLQEIRAQILREAQKRADEIEAQAKEEIDKILSEARQQAKQIIELANKETHMRSEAMRKEHSAAVEIARNVMVLGAKGAAIDQHAHSVQKGIAKQIVEKYYDKVVKNAIATAKQIAPSSELVIKSDKETQKILAKLGYKSVLSPNKGVIIQTKDGSIRLDASIDSMISSNAEMITSKISQELFSSNVLHQHAGKGKNAAKGKAKKAGKKAKK